MKTFITLILIFSFTLYSTDVAANDSVATSLLDIGGSQCCDATDSVGEPGQEGYFSITITRCVTGTSASAMSSACLQAGASVRRTMRLLDAGHF